MLVYIAVKVYKKGEMNNMINTKEKDLQPITSFPFIDPNKCDLLGNYKGKELLEILSQLDKFHLVYRSIIGLDKSDTFGIEIEYEQAQYELVREKLIELFNINMNDSPAIRWNSKIDISMPIASNGKRYNGEIISPILTDTKEIWQQIESVCQMLQNMQAKNPNSSAGHIHYGTQILGLNINNWLNMFKMWVIYEKIIFRFAYGENLGPRKSISTYAGKIGDILYRQLPNYEKYCNARELNRSLFNSKQYALDFASVQFNNVHRFMANNSFEVRCPNGTLNPIIWQNNVNFFAKLFKYCASQNFNDELITSRLRNYHPENNSYASYNQIYLQEAIELADLIFDNNLDKLCFLKQYLKSFQHPQKEEDNMRTIKL